MQDKRHDLVWTFVGIVWICMIPNGAIAQECTAQPPDTPCGDPMSNACTNPDTCDGAGACLPNHNPDGTACDDTLFCTDLDACVSGVCQSATPTDCSHLDGPCGLGSCDEVLDQCFAFPVNEGLACDDGDACTIGETCSAGICAGSAPDCSGSGDDCNDASCDPGGFPGNCDALTPANEGSPCNSGTGLCGSGSCVAASLIYVDVDAGLTADGTSWCSAWRSPQDALAVALSGDVILVANGEYHPDDCTGGPPCDRSASFGLINGVEIKGGYAGCGASNPDERNVALHETRLSGDLEKDDVGDLDDVSRSENSYHVVTASGTNATAKLSGCTVEAGNANGTNPDDRGAGLIARHGGATIEECIFRNNAAIGAGGGGFSCALPLTCGGSGPSNLSFVSCRFESNRANNGGAFYRGASADAEFEACTFDANEALVHGGAIYNFNLGSMTIVGCTFDSNTAADTGGAFLNNQAVPVILESTFIGNSADEGGAIGSTGPPGSNPMVISCVFLGNQADSVGGAVSNRSGTPQLFNSVFSGNIAQINGGALYNYNALSPYDIVNCTFTENTAVTGSGGAILNTGTLGASAPLLANCILWRNSDTSGMTEGAQLTNTRGIPEVSYSCMQGGWSGIGVGNIALDPEMVDADGLDGDPGTIDDNLRLMETSPCIDAGDNLAVPEDTEDLDGNLNVMEPLPFDVAGLLRFVDDVIAIDSGAGAPPHVDMGAHEFTRDCNTNSIPDSEELASCTGVAACSDCNLNGVLDECDDPIDDIPDECVNFTGVADDLWDNSQNWPLSGDIPNNDLMGTFAVTLDGVDNTFMNIDVELDACAVTENAVLRITQTGVTGDLTLAQSGGILMDSGTLTVGPDRIIGEPGSPGGANFQIIGGGLVEVEDSTIALTGDVVLDSGGQYKSVTGSESTNTATLTVDRVFIRTALSGPGEMTLNGWMSLTTSGNVLLDGSMAALPPQSESALLRRGGYLPPILRIQLASVASVGGDLTLEGVLVNSQPTGPVFELSSSRAMSLQGDFLNKSQRPEIFDATNGIIYLNGVSTQRFEVAGHDHGRSESGFEDNFAFRIVRVASGSTVTFSDHFENDGMGQSACTEALYVDELVLEAGSSISIDDCRVYYRTVVDSGGNVSTSGCGELVALDDSIPTVSEWGLAAMALLILTAGTMLVVRRRPSSA